MNVIFPFNCSGDITAANAPAKVPNPSRPVSARVFGGRMGVLLLWALIATITLVGCTGRQLGGSVEGWSPVAAEDGVVFVVTRQGEIVALQDLGNEGVKLKWAFSNVEEDIKGAYGTPAIGDDLVYVSAIDGVLYAVEKDTGTLGAKGWRVQEGTRDQSAVLVGAPTLNEAKTVVVVGSEDSNLYAYNARTGEPLEWSPFQNPQDKIWSTPLIQDGVIYFGSHDGSVYAVSLVSGELRWRFDTEGAVVAKPLIFGDMLIIGSFDKKLYGIDLKSGFKRWEFEGRNWFWAGAIAKGGVIFASSMDGHVYALDGSGNLLWKQQLKSPIISTPALLSRGLVVATKDAGLALLAAVPDDLGNNQVITDLLNPESAIKAALFALTIEETVPGSTREPTLDTSQEGSVFIGAEDGTVRRIRVSDGRLLWCFDTEENSECT